MKETGSGCGRAQSSAANWARASAFGPSAFHGALTDTIATENKIEISREQRFLIESRDLIEKDRPNECEQHGGADDLGKTDEFVARKLTSRHCFSRECFNGAHRSVEDLATIELDELGKAGAFGDH
jgi:hypothetical protein